MGGFGKRRELGLEARRGADHQSTPATPPVHAGDANQQTTPATPPVHAGDANHHSMPPLPRIDIAEKINSIEARISIAEQQIKGLKKDQDEEREIWKRLKEIDCEDRKASVEEKKYFLDYLKQLSQQLADMKKDQEERTSNAEES